MFAENRLTEEFDAVTAFLLSERQKSLSEAEWRFRVKGYGYALRRSARGVEVSRLPQNRHLGTLDA
ncbi:MULTISPECIES: hypothetical protein [unclassified Salipiger]|uniref:hypothetical protein n=1 Tax=unclassified Salipiger TaxID=2640570 RepID=UPI00080A955F|nr:MULTISPECIES: hypothetical protein [unclassified Salipiger]ANT61121.1 hypothetical protein AYJ57_12530 [Salipiger sp. CCB-MM3]NDW01066.1 hypothetical protein [Salipiger sp. PrR002]NDW58531.1 hypothetical protein [Salipiger sp. PrR004]